MKIDIRTGRPFSGKQPKNNKIVPLPLEKEGIQEQSSQLPAKVREIKNLLKKASPGAPSLKERHVTMESSGKSLPGHINRTAKLLREQH